jgi:hypothetical protein
VSVLVSVLVSVTDLVSVLVLVMLSALHRGVGGLSFAVSLVGDGVRVRGRGGGRASVGRADVDYVVARLGGGVAQAAGNCGPARRLDLTGLVQLTGARMWCALLHGCSARWALRILAGNGQGMVWLLLEGALGGLAVRRSRAGCLVRPGGCLSSLNPTP